MSEIINNKNFSIDICDIENQNDFIENINFDLKTKSNKFEYQFDKNNEEIKNYKSEKKKFKKSVSYPNDYTSNISLIKNKSNINFVLNQTSNQIFDNFYTNNLNYTDNLNNTDKLNNTNNLISFDESTDINSKEIELQIINSNEQSLSDSDSNSNESFTNNLIKNKTKFEYMCGIINKIANFLKINKINKVEIINKFITICLHIFIMIIFEIFFYFNYVVKIEKESFLNELDNYLSQIKNIPLTNKEKKLIKLILNSNNNNNYLLNTLYEQYIQSLELQKKILHNLLVQSCKMAGIVGIVLIILFLSGLANRKKIKWNWIFIENILMFIFLGIFEYFFFTTIIMGYNPITDAEIKYFVADKVFNYFNSTS